MDRGLDLFERSRDIECRTMNDLIRKRLSAVREFASLESRLGTRRLGHDYPFLLIDAIHPKVRQNTRVELMALMLVVGVGHQ